MRRKQIGFMKMITAEKVWRGCTMLLSATVAVLFLFSICVAVSTFHGTIAPSAVLQYILFLLLASTLMRGIFMSGRRRRGMAIPALMLGCLLLHVVVITLTHALYKQSMYSDFAVVEQCITSPIVKIGHAPEFFYWCNYELICSILGKVFCRDIRVAQYLNAICCVAAIMPVFRLSERIAGFHVAVFTSLLMGISPIMSVYGTVLTNEFVAAVMYIYAFYFIIQVLDVALWKEKSWYVLWAGLFLGLGQLMKPFAGIFLAMTAVMVAFDLLLFGRQRFWRWVGVFVLLLFTYFLVFESGQNAIVQIARPQRVDKGMSSGQVVKRLLVGLNADTNGEYNSNWVKFVNGLSEEERLVALKRLIADDYAKLPSLFTKKLKRVYSDHRFGWSWYDRSIRPKRVPGWLKSAMGVWNIAVLFLVFLGTLGLAVTRKMEQGKLRIGVAAALVTAAFTSLLLVFEVQERYKGAIYPIFFLLVPYARTWFSVEDNRLYGGVVKIFAIAREGCFRKCRK